MSQCTRSKTGGRSLKRHERQDDLDKMLLQSASKESQRDIRTRQHLMERSFAKSYRYGFKSRWRRLWRVKIQELLTSTIQNILTYIRKAKDHRKTGAARGLSGFDRYFVKFKPENHFSGFFQVFRLIFLISSRKYQNNISIELI
jgi:hypothetical protein